MSQVDQWLAWSKLRHWFDLVDSQGGKPMDITSAKTRYATIIDIVQNYRPTSVIEIGVHRGARSKHFCRWIPRGGWYRGYDAFDLVTDHDSVYNGKGPGSRQMAYNSIRRFAGSIDVGLVEGFTQDTLWGTKQTADFVFIDGDHRTTSIREDFLAVENSRLICFDDCVQNGPADAGAQPIVDELRVDSSWCVVQMPFRIPFKPQGWNEIAFAWRSGDISQEIENLIIQWSETVEGFCG